MDLRRGASDRRSDLGWINAASPLACIARDHCRARIKAFEQNAGDLRPGEVVIFHTGHNDKYLRPQPADTGLWLEPLQGKSEGWPAPGPDAIVYLK